MKAGVEPASLLVRGDEALGAGRWDEARTAFQAALREEVSAPALLGLADALWWLADAPAAVEHMERAYALLRRSGEVVEAAMTAIWLAAIHQRSLGNRAACSGWVARAARLLGEEEGPAHGWLWLARAYEATDPRLAVSYAERAVGYARRTGDGDLELSALGELGSALVAAGDVEAGLALVDEAMAGALGGEFGELAVVAATCCSMLTACDLAADLDRVRQWCRVADRFMRTYGCPFLYADCRMRYGSVLLATGRWEEAERELRTAMRAAPPPTAYHQHALARLAELRCRQGRVEEAAALLADTGDRGDLPPVRAAIRHARGEHEVAAAILARHLDSGGGSDLDRASALALLTEAHLARGDLPAARAAADRLAGFATEDNDRIAGHSCFAAGRVALGAGSPDAAAGQFTRAVSHFAEAELPYETSRARLALADALAAERPQVALTEAQTAYATFTQLGASGQADAAAALLRSLGAPARTGPKSGSGLTQREHEVLRLLGEGLSNPEIAQRLFISRKTASHHVSNVLAKLGLRNRSEAAAYAVRAVADRR